MEFLNKMHQANNDKTEGEEYKKPLFKENYEENNNNQHTTKDTTDEKLKQNNPTQPGDNPNQPEHKNHPPDEPKTAQPEQSEEKKQSREEKNLQSNLGSYWRCTDHDPHYDGNLGRQLRTRVTELNNHNEETMEDYWVLEDEDDTYFASWKKIYQANQQEV